VERTLGWTAEIVKHPPKPAPEEVMMAWMRELDKEGIPVDPKKFASHKGPRPFLPKRWVVERTFSWLSQNRRMSKPLREACGELGSLHLCGDEPPDGEEIGSIMRLFRQFLDGFLRSSPSLACPHQTAK
jgi:transposase